MAFRSGRTPACRMPADFFRRWLRRACIGLLLGFTVARLAASPGPGRRIAFDIPAGEALASLKQAAQQAGVEIMFTAESVEGVRTNPVKGQLTAFEALSRMVAGTDLRIVRDERTGALAISNGRNARRPRRDAPSGASQDSSQPNPTMNQRSPSFFAAMLLKAAMLPAALQGQGATAPATPEALKLSPFEVKSDRDYGYRATNTMTATRTAAPILETPLNIAVVTEEFFSDIGANYLNDGLKYVSNVSTTTLGNNGRIGGSGDGTKIRGFDIPFALRNGFRRNRNVVIRNIDRVEVAKGPVSMLFGQTAPGGLINYITKKPKYTNAGSATLRVGDYSLWSGEIEAERTFDVFGTSGNDVGVRAMYAQSEQDLFRDYEFRDEVYGLAQLAARPLPNLNMLFEVEYTDTKSNLAQGLPWGSNEWAADVAAALAAGRTADYNRWYANRGQWQNDIQVRTGRRPPGVDSFMARANPDGKFFEYNLTGPDARFNARSNSVTAEFDWKINDHVAVRYGFNRYDVFYFEKFLFTDTPSADYTFAAAGFASRNNDHVITSHQADAVFRWDFPGLKNTFVVGAEYINDYETVRRLAFDTAAIAQGSGISRATPPGLRPDSGALLNGLFYYDTRVQPPIRLDPGITTFDRPQNKSIVDQDREGFYASWRGQLWRDRINVNVGVRREEGDTSVFAPFTGVRTTDLQKGTTPMAGLNVRLRPGFVAFASYSESFVPSAARSATGPLVRPDEIVALGPIEGKGYEAGFKADVLQNTLSGTVSFFRVEQSNEPSIDYDRTNNDPRNRDPSVPSGIRFPFDVTFFVGGGARATEGIDGDLVWSPRRNFQLLASFTYTWKAEIEEGVASSPGSGFRLDGTSQVLPLISPNGTRLVRVPEYTAALFGKYSFTTGSLKGWSVGFGGRYMGEHIVFFGGADFQNFTQSAYTIFDATLGYETKFFDRPVRYTLSLTNLADKEYVDGTYTPGPPRRVQLTARFQF
jgi:outer membrane receptor protein involved in Fe transport